MGAEKVVREVTSNRAKRFTVLNTGNSNIVRNAPANSDGVALPPAGGVNAVALLCGKAPSEPRGCRGRAYVR